MSAPPVIAASAGAVVFGVVLLLAAGFAVAAVREHGTERAQSAAFALIGVGLGVDQLVATKAPLALAAIGIVLWVGASMRARDRARRDAPRD